MKKIKMKIVGYDPESFSLLACFASDTTKSSNPEDYPTYAYQPLLMWPDATDPEEIKRQIALAGIFAAKKQQEEELAVKNTEGIKRMVELVGQEAEYDLYDLYNPPKITLNSVFLKKENSQSE